MAQIILEPVNIAELREIILNTATAGETLEIRGGGSKTGIGAPDRNAKILSMSHFSGIIDYDPAELVLDVQAATPLAEIEALISARDQMLAFEPFDHGPIFGNPAGAATIGGIIAAGVAGSARLSAGAARDHFLGFEAVSGRGENFIGGAKVVKNVTGYDLPKILSNSWGRLAAMTRVTLKVLPRWRTRLTLAIHGLAPFQAYAAMALAMRSQAEVNAAAFLPATLNHGASVTALRLQGFGPSVAARCAMLQNLLRDTGNISQLGDAEAENFWHSIRDTTQLDPVLPLWRLNIPPSAACKLVALLEPAGLRWYADWAGGLIWANFTGDAAALRAAAATAGGHATLIRAPSFVRDIIPTFQPEPAGVAALSARVRASFDPSGVFATNRFLDQPDAN